MAARVEGDVEPSAPPAWMAPGPPTYDAVANQDRSRGQTLRRREQFTESLQTAGAAVSRWFGVAHNDEMETAGWRRTGTLPTSDMVHSYSALAQEEPEPEVEMENRRSDGEDEGGAAQQRRRGRNRLSQMTATLTLRRRRQRQQTREDVQKSLPKFWPVATIVVAVVEVGLLVAMLVVEGFAPIAFTPETVSDVIQGYGNDSEFVSREEVPNFFIGPSSSSLIHVGAKYTPCMRENVKFQVKAAQERAEEASLRCCLGRPVSQPQCGMLPQDVCVDMYLGTVLGGKSVCQSEMNSTQDCTGGVVLHPCCVGLLGECIITTKENCSFQKGYWHPNKLVCSEVSTECFSDICEFSWSSSRLQPEQGIRFLSAIFLYEGVIHLILIGVFKVPIMWKIETRISWLRVLLIYLLSGIGGYLVSGIFEATALSVGGSGALFGLFGVLLVELLQGWRWVTHPWLELVKLIIFVVIMLALGLLPYIDNFSQIGGFIFGVLAAFIFVPYITIGKWDRAKKLCLILTAVPIILALFLFGFVLFYNLPDPDFCPKCGYINCVPIVSSFCDDFISNVVSEVVTTPPPV